MVPREKLVDPTIYHRIRLVQFPKAAYEKQFGGLIFHIDG